MAGHPIKQRVKTFGFVALDEHLDLVSPTAEPQGSLVREFDMQHRFLASLVALTTACGGTKASQNPQNAPIAAGTQATTPGPGQSQGKNSTASPNLAGTLALTFDTSAGVKSVIDSIQSGGLPGLKLNDLVFLVQLAGTGNLSTWKKDLTVGFDQLQAAVADVPAGRITLTIKIQIRSEVVQTITTTVDLRPEARLSARISVQSLSLAEKTAQLAVEVKDAESRIVQSVKQEIPDGTAPEMCAQISGFLMNQSTFKIEGFKDACEQTQLKGMGFVTLEEGIKALFNTLPASSLCTKVAGTLSLTLPDQEVIEQDFSDGCQKTLLQSIGFK